MDRQENKEFVYLSSPHMSEREQKLLKEAFESNWIAPLGPQVDAFECELAQYSGRKCGCATASGTSAIHLGLMALGVQEGDEVLVSDLTFSATVNPICYLGAKPVFIDSDKETSNMDPNLLADELADLARKNKLPKVVAPVDLYGQCCDWNPIKEICARYEIPILEDAAEALGSSYNGKKAGAFGDVAAYSFNGNKIVTTSGGGMLMTDDENIAKKVRFWATQSREATADNHYEHKELGYNYRLSNLCAAVGRGQLQWLDERVAKRRAIFKFYKERLSDLPGIEFPNEPEGFYSVHWLTCFTIDPKVSKFRREDVQKALKEENIESRPIWKPMSLQPVFAKFRSRTTGVARGLFEKGICVPSGSNLSEETLERIVSTIRKLA